MSALPRDLYRDHLISKFERCPTDETNFISLQPRLLQLKWSFCWTTRLDSRSISFLHQETGPTLFFSFFFWFAPNVSGLLCSLVHIWMFHRGFTVHDILLHISVAVVLANLNVIQCIHCDFLWYSCNIHENRIHLYNHKVNYKQKKEWILTATSDVSPSSDPAGCPCIKGAAWCRQTHWFDIVSEFNRGGQLQQGYVIVVCLGIIVRVVDDLGHGAGLFIRVQWLLGFTSEIHNKTECAGAAKQ